MILCMILHYCMSVTLDYVKKVQDKKISAIKFTVIAGYYTGENTVMSRETTI